jgi:hypothetical protein
MPAGLQDLVLLKDGRVGVVYDYVGGGFVIQPLPGDRPVESRYDPLAVSVDVPAYVAVLNYFGFYYRSEWQGPTKNPETGVRAEYMKAPVREKDQFQRWLNDPNHLSGALPQWRSLLAIFDEYMNDRKFSPDKRKILYYLLFRRPLKG